MKGKNVFLTAKIFSKQVQFLQQIILATRMAIQIISATKHIKL